MTETIPGAILLPVIRVNIHHITAPPQRRDDDGHFTPLDPQQLAAQHCNNLESLQGDFNCQEQIEQRDIHIGREGGDPIQAKLDLPPSPSQASGRSGTKSIRPSTKPTIRLSTLGTQSIAQLSLRGAPPTRQVLFARCNILPRPPSRYPMANRHTLSNNRGIGEAWI